MGYYSNNGFVTLAQLDALYDDVQNIKNINSDLVAYKSDSSYTSSSEMLNLENTGFEARRINIDLVKNPIITGIVFGQDFTSAPVVTVNAISDRQPYLAYPENVTATECTIRVIPISTIQNKTNIVSPNSSGEYLNIIAIGPTVN